jgi:hypothetical protein
MLRITTQAVSSTCKAFDTTDGFVAALSARESTVR